MELQLVERGLVTRDGSLERGRGLWGSGVGEALAGGEVWAFLPVLTLLVIRSDLAAKDLERAISCM